MIERTKPVRSSWDTGELLRQSPGMPVSREDVARMDRDRIVKAAIERGTLPHLKTVQLQRDEARAVAASAVERTGIAVKSPSGKTLNGKAIAARLRRLEAVALVAVTERYSRAELAAVGCQGHKPLEAGKLVTPTVQRDRAGHLVFHFGTEAR